METGLRRKAREVFDAALAAADPERLLNEGLKETPEGWAFGSDATLLPCPGEGGRVRIFGAGKAACSIARALESRLAQRDYSGRLIVKEGHGIPLESVVVEEASHPLPGERGLEATGRLLADLRGSRASDRVFFLLTGGASALLVAPAAGISLEDKIATTGVLLRSGADIRELNAVRKHLSEVKGGWLASRMTPARVLGLVISDVIGDDLSAIGSGPLVGDPTTFAESLEIIRRYGLESKLPAPVLARLRAGAGGSIPETPKPGEQLFDQVRHVVLASNRLSLSAAREKAAALGFDVELFRSEMEGEVHEAARAFSQRLKALARGGRASALLAGGELTLEVKGTGLGGRNQEFALIAARELRGLEDVVVLSAGTDGTDGPTDAAGAFADGGTWERARAKGPDPEAALADNDSYRLFDSLGDLLRTGPTGTNVNDIVIGLVRPLGPQRGVTCAS